MTIATAAYVLAAPSPAHAAKSQLSVIEDSARILSSDPILQDASLDEMKALKADVLKIPVLWRWIAPQADSRRKPSGDLSDPGRYEAGKWAALDRAVLGARLRGLRVWLMVTAPAPRWAVSREDSVAPGSESPDPKAYGDFVKAVGRHFPAIDMWSVWTEPNLSLFLRPQFKNGVAVSAVHYRKLYRAAQASLARTGHASDELFFGELLPRAPKPRRANGTIPPLMWLRDFFCLNDELRPLTGAAARVRECNGFKEIKSTGFAYHPYTTPRGPLIDDDRPDSATIQHLARIYEVLDAAHRQNRLSQRRAKIFSSEYGFQSDPPDPDGTSQTRIPLFLNAGEYISFKDPRVATYSQYLLVDDFSVDSYQSGLRLFDGTAKRGIYDAYRLPLVVVRQSARSVTVWGKSRVVGTRAVELQADDGTGFTKLTSVSVNRRTGYFERVINGVDADAMTFRIKTGGHFSRKTKAGSAPLARP